MCEIFALSSRHPATVRMSLEELRAKVTGRIARNERGRARIGGFDVRIELAEDSAAIEHLDRCMAQFEDFCVVTQSVRSGIPVSVKVVDAGGRTVHESAASEAAGA